MQLDWHDVDFRAGVLRLSQTKSGKVRAIPMHRLVDALLFGMCHPAGRPTRGHVFLSRRGTPYTDTRALGGNPLSKAHETP